MVLYDASGTASGSSTATSAVTVNFHMSGDAQGSSSGSGSCRINFILGGFAQGTSFADDGLVTDASGDAQGSSSAVVASTVVEMTATGHVFGSSFAKYIQPLPALGSSSLAAHAVVERPKPPINAAVAPPKTFKWLQLLQRGDLPLYLCDGQGGRVGATYVRYRLIRVRPDGSRQNVGPQEKTPVQGMVGEYYATGLAGETGQPGRWIIQWTYQVSPDDPLSTVEMPFLVTDAVSAPNPRSVLDRKVKFGWN